MILKRDLIPMQSDTENGGGVTGELRPNVRTYADRRDIESRSDQPVFEAGRQHRICRTEPRRKVRVCAAIAGRARVCTARQEAARRHPCLPEQNDRLEPAADRAADPDVHRNRNRRVARIPTPMCACWQRWIVPTSG